MGRSAKLVKVKVGKQLYWSTSSGGKRAYFGNCKEVSRKDAEQAFISHRQGLLTGAPPSFDEITVGELCERYLEWSLEYLEEQNCQMKKSCLSQWCNHKVGSGATRFSALFGWGKFIGDQPATKVTSEHLDDFIAARRKDFRLVGISAAQLAKVKRCMSIGPAEGKVDLNSAIKARLLEIKGIGDNFANKILANRPFKSVDDLDDLFRDKAQPIGPTMLAALQTQVMAAWRWAVEVGRILPPNCQPFRGVRKVKIDQPLKLESDLPTIKEVAALFRVADSDFIPGFGDLLRCYYAIGPRTGELARIRVCDVEFGKQQVTLIKHKRSTTMTTPKARTLTLNDETVRILRRLCHGKGPQDVVFTQANGKPWTTDRLDKSFQKVREAAGVRDALTIYSFRHLWVSDQLQADTETVLIADMAGTSIRQIERTYGHIRTEHKAEAQRRLDALRARKQAG